MCNKIIGELDCPLCGSDKATIHEQSKGKARFYIRCYESHGSNVMRCGTLQAIGPTGQEYIKKHGRFYDVAEPEKTVVDAIAPTTVELTHDQTPEEAVIQAPARKSFMEMLIG